MKFGFPDRQLNHVKKVVEDFMVDTVEVERPGASSFDEATGIYGSGTPTLIFSGKARISPTSPSTEVIGEELVSWRDAQFYFPLSAPQMRVGDLITVTSSKDERLNGRVWRVSAVRHGTFQASREVSAQSLAESRTSENLP